MSDAKMSERMRRQLDRLSPEERAKALAIIARTRTPEYRAREAADRQTLDRERRETGRIAVASESLTPADLDRIRELLGGLRRERESRGLSLSDMTVRTGIDKAALSRLENGLQPNPTLATVTRYARALGMQLAWSLEDASDAVKEGK
jgi:ribosome-binding protein aMBF1 (putative translation factor)